jgi:hypothetical protein
MSAGEQGPQRGKREASHAASVAQKLACGLILVCSCDDGVTAPPIDPSDLDGDGIPNEADLCPLAKDPAQHDEDGDGFGDLCDVCPTVVDPLQSDTGEIDSISAEDGVGDACDPRPTRNGDKIGALHTFDTDTTPSWLGEGWTIAGDRARASGAARWQHRRAETGDAITARLALESIAWTSTGGSVSVALDGDGIETARSCALFQDRDSNGNDELEVRELGGAVLVRELAEQVVGPVELIVSRGVDHRTGTGVIHCVLRGPRVPGAEHAIELTIDTIDDVSIGQYVFAASAADVVATSLVVYKSPVACPSLGLACNQPGTRVPGARNP